MKKDYLFPAWCVFLGLCFGFMILLFYMGTNQKEVETRPDIEICYGVVEQRGDLYGAFSPDGDFVATDPNEFKPGDKVLTTIIYNPNNDICDDIIKNYEGKSGVIHFFLLCIDEHTFSLSGQDFTLVKH